MAAFLHLMYDNSLR